jgi:hypothetical protein
MCFLHWSQFSESLTLANGWGTSTIFVPRKWRWWILSGAAEDQLMNKAIGSEQVILTTDQLHSSLGMIERLQRP